MDLRGIYARVYNSRPAETQYFFPRSCNGFNINFGVTLASTVTNLSLIADLIPLILIIAFLLTIF